MLVEWNLIFKIDDNYSIFLSEYLKRAEFPPKSTVKLVLRSFSELFVVSNIELIAIINYINLRFQYKNLYKLKIHNLLKVSKNAISLA